MRELLVIEPDAGFVTELAVSVKDEALAGLERHLSLGELPDANLRALEVGHDADLAFERPSDLADEAGAVEVVLRRPMRKIEADDVDAGGDHPM